MKLNERHIPLDGASNFRDFGGYDTPNGPLRTGCMYRSDRLSRLTERDYARLETLRLRLIVDLRRSSERADEPTRWRGPAAPENMHAPVFDDDGKPTALLNLAADPQTRTAEAAAELMREVYRKLVREPRPLAHFAHIFTRLASEDTAPFVVHCSGGKDRTGVFVALLQTALGMAWDAVHEDFMLTERLYDGSALLAERNHQILETHGVAMDAEALAPVFGVDPSYLEAARSEAEQLYGSWEGLLARLGVNGVQREALARRLIT